MKFRAASVAAMSEMAACEMTLAAMQLNGADTVMCFAERISAMKKPKWTVVILVDPTAVAVDVGEIERNLEEAGVAATVTDVALDAVVSGYLSGHDLAVLEADTTAAAETETAAAAAAAAAAAVAGEGQGEDPEATKVQRRRKQMTRMREAATELAETERALHTTLRDGGGTRTKREALREAGRPEADAADGTAVRVVANSTAEAAAAEGVLESAGLLRVAAELNGAAAVVQVLLVGTVLGCCSSNQGCSPSPTFQLRERRFRVYEEAPGLRHFALAPVPLEPFLPLTD